MEKNPLSTPIRNNAERDEARRRASVAIQDRLRTDEERERFQELAERAKTLEQKLFRAFGPAPSTIEMKRATESVQEELIQVAREAREFARQYRNFNVGAVVLGFRTMPEMHQNPWVVMFDANTKSSASDPKCCAEQYLMDRAEGSDERMDQIFSFTVAAEPQTDNDSSMTQVTLTPCKPCRDRMLQIAKEKPPLITLETEIITAHADQPAFRKYQKVKDLHKFHKEYVDID